MALDYTPLTKELRNPDTMFLLHKSIAPYTKLLLSPNRLATAIEITSPDRPPFVEVNIQKKEKGALGMWLNNVPNICVLLGNLDDSI